MPLHLHCFTFPKEDALKSTREGLYSHLLNIVVNLSLCVYIYTHIRTALSPSLKQHTLFIHPTVTHCCLPQQASGVQRQIDTESTLCVYVIFTIIYLLWLLQGAQLLKIQIKSYRWYFKDYHADISGTQSSNIQLHLLPTTRKSHQE